jgi:hypothetical protein
MNVRSTTSVWDAVYAKVSGPGILDHSEHVEVFLNSTLGSLVAIVSMQPTDLLEFRYCYCSKAAMLWVCYCVPVGCLVDRATRLCVCYCVPVGCLVDRAARLCVCYCVLVCCLVDRAAMLRVCYFVPVGCLVDRAAIDRKSVV